MPKRKLSKNTIRGSCPEYVCGCCRTKYGWEHQSWCDNYELVEPGCPDCAYFNERSKRCRHPVKKQKRRKAG